MPASRTAALVVASASAGAGPRARSVFMVARAKDTELRGGELLREMAERGERDRGHGGDRKSQSQPATVKVCTPEAGRRNRLGPSHIGMDETKTVLEGQQFVVTWGR